MSNPTSTTEEPTITRQRLVAVLDRRTGTLLRQTPGEIDRAQAAELLAPCLYRRLIREGVIEDSLTFTPTAMAG